MPGCKKAKDDDHDDGHDDDPNDDHDVPDEEHVDHDPDDDHDDDHDDEHDVLIGNIRNPGRLVKKLKKGRKLDDHDADPTDSQAREIDERHRPGSRKTQIGPEWTKKEASTSPPHRLP